jgi:hypothetical protein
LRPPAWAKRRSRHSAETNPGTARSPAPVARARLGADRMPPPRLSARGTTGNFDLARYMDRSFLHAILPHGDVTVCGVRQGQQGVFHILQSVHRMRHVLTTSMKRRPMFAPSCVNRSLSAPLENSQGLSVQAFCVQGIALLFRADSGAAMK